MVTNTDKEQEDMLSIPKADFMTDMRNNFMATPIYFRWMDFLTGGRALHFSRIAAAGLCVLASIFIPWYLSSRSFIQRPSYLVLPNLLTFALFIYIAYLILRPSKQRSTLAVGIQYFIAIFFKYPFDQDKFQISRIENNLVYFKNNTIGMCYEVEGVFNDTMFDKDVISARKQLTAIRDRLNETTTISMLEISKTSFEKQKQYLTKIQDNATSDYQIMLAKRTRLHYNKNLKSEQILKTTIMFRVRNEKEYNEIEKSLPLLMKNNFKRCRPLSENETAVFLDEV